MNSVARRQPNNWNSQLIVGLLCVCVCDLPLLLFLGTAYSASVCVCAGCHSSTRSFANGFYCFHLAMTSISSVWCEAMNANRKIDDIFNKIQCYANEAKLYNVYRRYVHVARMRQTANSERTQDTRSSLPLCAWLFHRTQFKANPYVDSWNVECEFAHFYYYFISIARRRWMCIVLKYQIELQTSTFLFVISFCEFRIKNRNKFTFVCSGWYCRWERANKLYIMAKLKLKFLLRRIRCERTNV